MKRVTFEVAKALKEAGYPQDLTISHYTYYGDLVPYGIAGETGFDVPTYLEAWLWLWREKKISIDISFLGNGKVCSINPYYPAVELEDPEEVIKGAINYLVENNLIK